MDMVWISIIIGTLKKANGIKYVGQWADDKSEGNGNPLQ